MTGAALFDWDGTLLDSREALLDAWHSATEQILATRFPVTADEERLVFTKPGAELFPQVAGDAGRAARLSDAFQGAYETASKQVRPFPGVVEMLTVLRDQGVALAVVTSKSRLRFEADARHIGVHELIDLAVCQEDSATHKPDPAPVLRALEMLGVSPDRAVLAGDTPVDVEAGAAAGLPVLGVAWGAASEAELVEAGAVVIAHSANELAGLVMQAGGASEMIAT